MKIDPPNGAHPHGACNRLPQPERKEAYGPSGHTAMSNDRRVLGVRLDAMGQTKKGVPPTQGETEQGKKSLEGEKLSR